MKGCHGNKMHMTAVVRATEFIKCMQRDKLPISQVLDEKSQAQVKKSQEVAKSKPIYTFPGKTKSAIERP